MTLREEATELVKILPNPGKYSEKLTALLAAAENANAALAALKAAEDAKAMAMAARLEEQVNLLASLTAQSDEIANANASATASRVAAENDLARRVGELETAKQQHADKVEHNLRNIAARQEGLARKEAELGAVAEARAQDLRAKQDGLAAHHFALRTTIAEARQGLVAVIAA
jgi:hypothetical protein